MKTEQKIEIDRLAQLLDLPVSGLTAVLVDLGLKVDRNGQFDSEDFLDMLILAAAHRARLRARLAEQETKELMGNSAEECRQWLEHFLNSRGVLVAGRSGPRFVIQAGAVRTISIHSYVAASDSITDSAAFSVDTRLLDGPDQPAWFVFIVRAFGRAYIYSPEELLYGGGSKKMRDRRRREALVEGRPAKLQRKNLFFRIGKDQKENLLEDRLTELLGRR